MSGISNHIIQKQQKGIKSNVVSLFTKLLIDDRFKNKLIPLILVFVNLVLKLRHLGTQPVAGDEAFSIYVAQVDIPTIISYLGQGNNPPLFEIILHFWIKISGIGVLSVRFLPCLFSSLTVWFVYKTGVKFFSFKAGLLASILFSLSNYQMYFAHETRVYSLFLLLTSISFYAYMMLLERNSVKFRIIHVITIVLLPYAHYFGFFVLFTQLVISLLIREARIKILKIYFINLSVAIFCFIPFIAIFIKRFYESSIHGTWLHPVTSLGQLHDVMKLLVNDSVTNYMVFIIIAWLIIQKFFAEIIPKIYFRYFLSLISIFFLFYAVAIMFPMPYYWEFAGKVFPMTSYILFIVLLIFLSLKSEQISVYSKVLLVWFFLPLLVMFISSFWIPMFLDRYLIYFTGAFYLLTGLGVYYLEGQKPLQLGLLVILALGITFTTNVDKKRRVTEVVSKIKEIKTKNTVVYMCPDYFEINFAYYYSRSCFEDIDKPETKEKLYKHLASENIYPIVNYKQIDSLKLKNADKVVFIDAAADFSYPENGIKAKLDSSFNLKQQYEIYEIYRILEYTINQGDSF